jgi:hypothetical protein
MIMVTRATQRELFEECRHSDPLPGAAYVELRVNERGGGWSSTIAPVCWLPWNRSPLPVRHPQ